MSRQRPDAGELQRALVVPPLDEATGNLDVVNEQRVEQHLATLAATRIIIAHRLSTIRDAELIIVLEDGQIVEYGMHVPLLAQNGVYSALANRQTPSISTAVCDEA